MKLGYDMHIQDKIVLWPIYFDSTKSRLQGRRICKNMGVPSPKLDEIQKAVEKLNLRYENIPDARHPQMPWQKTGMVIVSKSSSKAKIIKNIAKELPTIRAQNRIQV
jgi:signal recognition particle subunit SRP19